jgi:hypothetical protein
MDNVRHMPQRESHTEVNRLFDEIWSAINQPQFENMAIAEIVGTLEFVKNKFITGDF